MLCRKNLHATWIFCLWIFGVRPQDQDEDVRSDEDVDDEEFILTKYELKQAMKLASEDITQNMQIWQNRRKDTTRLMNIILVKV